MGRDTNRAQAMASSCEETVSTRTDQTARFRAEGLDLDAPAVRAALDLLRWELQLFGL